MKKLTLVLVALILSACAVERQKLVPVVVKETVEVKEKTLQGLYFFKEASTGAFSGALGITVDYDGRVDVEQVEEFRSTNLNGTFGTHPTVSFSNVMPSTSDLVIYANNVNYSNSNDLEKDDSGSNLSSGQHYTVYVLEKVNDVLSLTVQIHDGNTSSSGGINKVVIERVFEEIK